jgi:hypothetical protein
MMDGYVRHRAELNICQLWDLPAAPALAENPISSDIPTLVLAGRYDPITPPEWALAATAGLTNRFYVEFESMGHNLDAGSHCADAIKRDFLLDPGTPPDTSCLERVPDAEYVLLSDTLPAAGFDRSINDIDYGVPDRGVLLFEGVTYTSLLVLLAELVTLLVLALIALASGADRRLAASRFDLQAHAAAGLAAITSIGTVVLLSMVNQSRTEPMLRLLGLIRSTPLTTALGLAVYAQIAAGVVLVLATVRAWTKRRSTLLNRAALSLVCAAALSFWPFFVRWDLLTILFGSGGWIG